MLQMTWNTFYFIFPTHSCIGLDLDYHRTSIVLFAFITTISMRQTADSQFKVHPMLAQSYLRFKTASPQVLQSNIHD